MSSSSFVVFDIETGPLADDEVLKFSDPYPPMKAMGDFDPATVRLGNLKDQAKIAEKIEAKRDEHNKARVKAAEDWAAGWDQYKADCIDRAALNANTGLVLAIGLEGDKGPKILADSDERLLLQKFWTVAEKVIADKRILLGHYCKQFDLPFLMRRSMKHGLRYPNTLLDWRGFWSQQVVDLNECWGCGDRRSHIKLDVLAKYFGVGGKPDGMSGKDFAATFYRDRDAALNYLRNDLDMTRKVAIAMGVPR